MLGSVVLFVSILAQAAPTVRKVELKESYHPPVKSGRADLYIPLPIRQTSYQKVLQETHTSNAAWVKEEDVKVDGNGDTVRILHAHWNQARKPSLRLTEILKLTDRQQGQSEAVTPTHFLKPTPHVQTNGIVYKTAMKITKGITDPDQKAAAIYNWIVDNTFRDPKVRGCGTGDVKSMLKSGDLGGKCADLNSLFVGLARASGIPAREVFGLRVAPSFVSKSLGTVGDVSKAQHCRAEYYSTTRKAWFPSDPADVRKVVLAEKLPLKDPHVQTVRKELFGRWEGNWVALNSGRDFKLSNGKTINFLMYPQLIDQASSPDGVDPKQVGYQYVSKVLASRR